MFIVSDSGSGVSKKTREIGGKDACWVEIENKLWGMA